MKPLLKSIKEVSEKRRPLFCRLGLHWPISTDWCLFVDKVSGKEVFEGGCPCGFRWMKDTYSRFPMFAVKKSPPLTRHNKEGAK